ncbi:hypothetical protein QA639_28735 [Bradyrhizobium pachyrhizi]|uniref:type IIL restriction-modification enzyme MmeI n=1 Tax=Bradyrhizobium pachyrhizi TaxID=280333 RepID=UPI0024B12C45|nr:type IIL restriction-modification enzyme MmeI [Bradyrhizobium pachyrhizi]WFU53628.1 hypothetical protein QA639_28735 [Bradyrhizobium pachyrhizi]
MALNFLFPDNPDPLFGNDSEEVSRIELTKNELELLGKKDEGAAWQNWAQINLAIFGTIFQQSMDKGERHAYGAHFTHEVDIQRIVGPTIVRPWRERIDAAKTMAEQRHDRMPELRLF